MPSSYLIFDVAERIELLWSEIYGTLADRFAGDSATLFRRLADEELQHARRIRLMASQYRHDRRLSRHAPTVDGNLDSLLAEGKRLLKTISNGEWDASVEALKARVADLEMRCSGTHAQALAQAGDPSLRAFFQRLAEQDEEHRHLLLTTRVGSGQPDRGTEAFHGFAELHRAARATDPGWREGTSPTTESEKTKDAALAQNERMRASRSRRSGAHRQPGRQRRRRARRS